jgi:hypothetical protein
MIGVNIKCFWLWQGKVFFFQNRFLYLNNLRKFLLCSVHVSRRCSLGINRKTEATCCLRANRHVDENQKKTANPDE